MGACEFSLFLQSRSRTNSISVDYQRNVCTKFIYSVHILHICKLGSKSVDCSHQRGLNINDLHCLVKVGGGQRKTSCAFYSCSYIFVFLMICIALVSPTSIFDGDQELMWWWSGGEQSHGRCWTGRVRLAGVPSNQVSRDRLQQGEGKKYIAVICCGLYHMVK